MSKNVISFEKSRSDKLLNRTIEILKEGIVNDLHPVIQTYLPIMTKPIYRGFVMGRWITLIEEIIESLETIRSSDVPVKEAQYEVLNAFVNEHSDPDIHNRLSNMPLVLWYDNGNNVQIRFVPYGKRSIPIIGYINGDNIIDGYISDCADFYGVKREDVINLDALHVDYDVVLPSDSPVLKLYNQWCEVMKGEVDEDMTVGDLFKHLQGAGYPHVPLFMYYHLKDAVITNIIAPSSDVEGNVAELSVEFSAVANTPDEIIEFKK